MGNNVVEMPLSAPQADLDLPGFAVVREKSYLGAVPDLSQQIKPIADNVLALPESAPPSVSVTPLTLRAKRQSEPTLRLDAGTLRDGHEALALRQRRDLRKWRFISYTLTVAVLGMSGVAAYGFRSELRGSLGKLAGSAPVAVAKSAAPVKQPILVWAKFPPLPDPALTPGEMASPQAHSAIPALVQKKVLDNYRIQAGSKATVVCRLVPAEIGGTSNSQNLFPLQPAQAELKSRLDRALVEEWKAGKISKYEAVWELANDWLAMTKNRTLPANAQLVVQPVVKPVAQPGSQPSVIVNAAKPLGVRMQGPAAGRRGPVRSRRATVRPVGRRTGIAATSRGIPSPAGELTAELSSNSGSQ